MPPPSTTAKRLLYWLIAGTRGGESRARIISSIRELPKNANQLSEDLRMDYKTVRHHLDVLRENGLVVPVGEGYAMTYFLSQEMEANYATLEEILGKIGKKQKRVSKVQNHDDQSA
uniref:ArsR family transcriptional regulator n=1 Tax=Candidatus Methanomethylicus mesodigestus TaxID=1867258 RepID=A0A7C3EW71_9CREN